MKFLYLSVKHGKNFNLNLYPSTGYKGNLTGMREKYWGKEVKVVQCGNNYYHVPESVFNEILESEKKFKF